MNHAVFYGDFSGLIVRWNYEAYLPVALNAAAPLQHHPSAWDALCNSRNDMALKLRVNSVNHRVRDVILVNKHDDRRHEVG